MYGVGGFESRVVLRECESWRTVEGVIQGREAWVSPGNFSLASIGAVIVRRSGVGRRLLCWCDVVVVDNRDVGLMA